ncbi:MAG: translocation/assembly module TamB domain-containing protein [Pseudomonadota bacterium]
MVSLALITAAAAALPWLLERAAVQRWLALALTQAVEVATGERASIGGVLVEPWRRRVEVRGLLISAREGGEPILALAGAEAIVGRDGWTPTLTDLTLDQPVLHLHVDPDGLREFRGRVRTEGVGGTPWERLTVRDATARIELQGGRLDVEHIELAPGDEPGRYDLDVAAIAVAAGALEQRSEPVRWEGITFDLDRLAVPDLTLRFPVVAVVGNLALRRDGPLAGHLWLSSDLTSLDGWLLPRRRLEGMLDLDVQLAGDSAHPRVSGALALSPWTLVQAPAGVALGPDEPGRSMSFGALSGGLGLTPEGDGLELIQGQGPWAGGIVSLDVTWTFASGALGAELRAHGVHLAPILRSMGVAPTPWVELEADLLADLTGQLSPFGLGGSFRIDTRDLRTCAGPAEDPRSELILAIPQGTLEGELDIAPGALEATIQRLELPRGRGTGRATIGFGAHGPLDLHLTLQPADLSVFRPLSDLGLAGRGRVSAHLWGPFGALQLSGDLDVRGLAVWGIPFADQIRSQALCPTMKELEFRGFEARRGQTRYSGNLAIAFGAPLTMETQVLVREGRLSDLAGMFVDIPGIDADVSGTLELEGPPDRLDGSADLALRDIDLVGERFPSGHAWARMEAGRFTLRDLVMARQGEAESLLVRGSVGPGWAENFEIVSDGLRLETLDALRGLGLPLEGRLQVVAHARGSLLDPTFDARITASGVRSHGVEVPGSVLTLSSEGSVVTVAGDLFRGGARVAGSADWSTAAYGFDVTLDGLPLHLLHPMAAAGEPVLGEADGRVRVEGVGSSPPDLDATLDRVTLSWGAHRLASEEPWRLQRRSRTWRLGGVNLRGPGTWGRFDASVDENRALAAAGEGEIELEWLRLLGPDFLRAGGSARWSLSVGGSAREPEIAVQAHLRDGLVRGTWFPHTFEGIEGDLVATASGYALHDFTGRMGGGTFAASGDIHAEGWRPTSWNLTGDIQGARIHFVEDLPPTLADAHLRFDGPAGQLVLGGDITLREVLFNERIDWETWVVALEQERLSAAAPEETADYFSMDLGIRADGTGRLRNNVGDARLSADLCVIGDTSRPGLTGRVWVDDDGRVFLSEREFDVTRAELRFVDPYTFDPDLDMLFETDVAGRDRDYHVYYRVTGPFSAWRAEASSAPALSQADINFLLLFGATRAELEEYGELEGALAWEGIDLLSKGLGSGALLDRFGAGDIFWDRIDVTTGTSTRGARNLSSEPRLVVEKDISPPWDLTVTGEINLMRREDWYVSLEKRMARRLFMTTYYAGEQYERSLDIGGAFGAEFKLRWEIE